jgi:ADP-heptose:LPS heptosyltransferase
MGVRGLDLKSEKPRSIAIFRALQLGDLLCAVPAFRALRCALSQAKVTLIGLPWAKSFVSRFNHYINDFVAFPGYPGLPEQAPRIDEIPDFLSSLQRRRFDLVIQLHGSGTQTNAITALFGAKRSAGFYPKEAYCPDPQTFLPYPEEEPEIWRNLRLLEFLGVPLEGDHLEFPLSQEDYLELETLPQTQGLRPREYVCIHPGARWAHKRWPAERFAAVADALNALGLKIVLTGCAQEAHLTQAVGRAMKSPYIDTASPISIGGLAALLMNARLLVSNDTGVAHLAPALQLLSVVIFFSTDPRRWAPLNTALHRTIYDPAGVSVESVLREALDLLR